MLLYSTNPYIKYYLNEEFRNGKHYVWCSPYYDGGKRDFLNPSARTPPSSNPASLYERYRSAVERGDSNDPKINSQKATIKDLAVQWFQNNSISNQEKENIVYLVENGNFGELWTPLIYIVVRSKVDDGRIQKVPKERCAGLADEYIIEDLQHDEFQIIQP